MICAVLGTANVGGDAGTCNNHYLVTFYLSQSESFVFLSHL